MDVKAILQAYVKSIKFESNFNKEFTIVDPFGEKPKSSNNDYGKTVQPHITIELNSMDPVVFSPYGKPDPEVRETMLKRIKVAGVAVGGLFAGLLYKAFKKK
jgi:hypothetical protein